VPVRRTIRRIRRRIRRPVSPPLLSVVVPIYNVEEYLEECLESLQAQQFTDFEVVMVDDGSTDGSPDVAQRFVDADPRFRLIRQPNGGLGAARNWGVQAARGEFLAFLDSDDTLTPHAYAVMMRTIERTGSDFVVGTLKKDDGRQQVALRLMRENHRRRRERVTLADVPMMLADVFAVNKIFRRSFWDKAGLRFPVGLRYEDQPALTRAFLAARRFDVIPETVYLWRVRHDGSSITQRRGDEADLEDRILTKRISSNAVCDAAPHIRAVWFGVILPVDMWEYFRGAASASDRYWKLLREAMSEFWNDETVRFEHTSIPVQQRLMGWFVEQDRLDDLRELVTFLDQCAGDFPLEVRHGRVVARLPGVEHPTSDVPEEVYTLGAHELTWESRIRRAVWNGRQLRLHGFALIRNAPTGGSPTEISARLHETGREARPSVVDLPVTPEVEPRASQLVGRSLQDYDDCGFSCTIDVADLAASRPDAPSSWSLALERRVERLARGGPVTGFNRPELDMTWHGVDLPGGAGRVWARLRAVGEELVLELQPD
jgi:glycosyltransferase involved in cell wall biosynthesis